MQGATKAQLQIGGYTEPTQWTHLEHPAQATRETVPLDPTGHLLHKVTLPGMEAIAALLKQ